MTGILGLKKDIFALGCSYLPVTGGHRDVGVARQEVVRILRMGYTDTMPTKWLVLLTGRSSRELQPDAERDETKAKLMPSQAWQACSQHVTSLYTCSRALPVTLPLIGI